MSAKGTESTTASRARTLPTYTCKYAQLVRSTATVLRKLARSKSTNFSRSGCCLQCTSSFVRYPENSQGIENVFKIPLEKSLLISLSPFLSGTNGKKRKSCQESNGLFLHELFHLGLRDLAALLVSVINGRSRLECSHTALVEWVLSKVGL